MAETTTTDEAHPGLLVKVAIALINGYAFLYDILTLPVYFLLQKPWKHRKSQVKVYQLNEKDPYSPITREPRIISEEEEEAIRGVDTLDIMFRRITRKNDNKRAFGTRKILNVIEETQPDGKVLKKLDLADHFEWITYAEAERRVDQLSKSLRVLGIVPGTLVAVFAETRVEWMLTAQACFRINAPIATMFSTLGDEGIIQCLQETQAKYLFTSADLLGKVQRLVPNAPYLSHIIYMEGPQVKSKPCIPGVSVLLTFSEFERQALTTSLKGLPEGEAPKPESLAILMYTSGSTGIPKGVKILHKNAVFAALSLSNNVAVEKDHQNLAFLPLAHAMEMIIEMLVMWNEQSIAYSSPLTLTDKSTGVIEGQRGDISIIRPTTIGAVPLVLDRIKKSFQEGAKAKGPMAKALLDTAVAYKTSWRKRGYSTPLLNRIFFKRFKDLLGGRLYLIATGGAPFCPDTHDFVAACLDVIIVVAYGLTETSALATISSPDDRTTGHCGPPGEKTYIKLVDWKEGGYSPLDRPNPRGEIVVGGGNVSEGYYKRPELTRDYFREEGGIRWFYTGDIGELLPSGCLKIIDRKKDLVKLQAGEYVALGKIEALLKTSPFVDNVCVTAGGELCDRLVALVVPNLEKLQSLAVVRGEGDRPLGDLCRNPAIARRFSQILNQHAQKCGLSRRESPVACRLCHDEWTPESGLVTAAFKLRRHAIQQFYSREIQEMYSQHSV